MYCIMTEVDATLNEPQKERCIFMLLSRTVLFHVLPVQDFTILMTYINVYGYLTFLARLGRLRVVRRT